MKHPDLHEAAVPHTFNIYKYVVLSIGLFAKTNFEIGEMIRYVKFGLHPHVFLPDPPPPISINITSYSDKVRGGGVT